MAQTIIEALVSLCNRQRRCRIDGVKMHLAEHATAEQIWRRFRHSRDQRTRTTWNVVSCSIEKTTNTF